MWGYVSPRHLDAAVEENRASRPYKPRALHRSGALLSAAAPKPESVAEQLQRQSKARHNAALAVHNKSAIDPDVHGGFDFEPSHKHLSAEMKRRELIMREAPKPKRGRFESAIMAVVGGVEPEFAQDLIIAAKPTAEKDVASYVKLVYVVAAMFSKMHAASPVVVWAANDLSRLTHLMDARTLVLYAQINTIKKTFEVSRWDAETPHPSYALGTFSKESWDAQNEFWK
jgi:hypothetical protein